MNNTEDILELKYRVSHLESAHTENNTKILSLIESFNLLTLNLSKLTTSINVAVKMAVGCGTLVVFLTGGFWAYYTHSTDLLIKQITISQDK